MKRAALLLVCLPLVGCVPNLSRTVENATERAVNRSVDRAVDKAVTAAIDRTAQEVAEAFIGLALASSDVRLTDAFTLDMFSGSWTVTLSGDVNNVYQKVPASPTGDEEFSDIGIGVRGIDGDGAPFYGLNLIAERGGETFVLVLLEAHNEIRSEGATEDEVVQMVSLEVGGVTYVGEAVVTLTEDATRMVGSFRAPSLTREGDADAPGTLSAEGSFDVPTNPVGSLIVAEAARPDS